MGSLNLRWRSFSDCIDWLSSYDTHSRVRNFPVLVRDLYFSKTDAAQFGVQRPRLDSKGVLHVRKYAYAISAD